jgi:glucosamine-6-phosphate deaminase
VSYRRDRTVIRLIVTEDYEELSKQAARLVAEQITQKPESVIGFATGSTPIGMYDHLIKMHQRDGLDFSKITTFNLDEYVGLSPDHPKSYCFFMWKQLFSKINVTKEHIHVPTGIFTDADAVCEQYEADIERAGGIDLQILGIGVNGHIGFNEPGESLTLATHITQLAEETIQANARFFANKNEVPRQAITMGIGSIMKARAILLLANGENKAEAVQHLFSGKIDPRVPASILQLHPDVTLVLDKKAASLLTDKREITIR